MQRLRREKTRNSTFADVMPEHRFKNMSRKYNWVDVAAGIVIKNRLILAVKRPQGKPLSGFWEFPGGKARPGESTEKALIRELEEELSITPVSFRLWLRMKKSYHHLDAHVHFYLVHEFQGAVIPRENQETAWIEPDRIKVGPFLEADEEILNQIALLI